MYSYLFNVLSQYVFAYYLFTFEQYIIHNIQHTSEYFASHRIQHHRTYSRNNIAMVIKNNSLFSNIDLYFYGNILVFIVHYFLFNFNILLFQLFLAWLSYYFHNEYHNPNTLWKDCFFFKYLKRKHMLHHKFPKRNYFLIDPTFDIIFRTYL